MNTRSGHTRSTHPSAALTRSGHPRPVRRRSDQARSDQARSGEPRSGDTGSAPPGPRGGPDHTRDRESGSLVTEYGLIAILGATLAGLAIRWASDGAVLELFGAIMGRIQSIVGV